MAGTSKRAWKLQEFVAHSANVNCLALGQKSGRVLVTGGDDKKVNLWAVGNHNCIMSLRGHSSPVSCVQFSGSEELVCAGAASGALKIWDLEAVRIVRTLTEHKAAIAAQDFHPYGDFLASGSLDTHIKLWDIRRKGCIFTYRGHGQAVNSVKISPDGQWIASASDDGLVKLWDLRAGKSLHEFSDHRGAVTSVEFHPHDFLLASASADRSVNIWDLEKFTLVSSSEKDLTPVRCLNFAAAGECLYGAGHDSLRVYGWEPDRVLDSVAIAWGRVQHIATLHNQLVAASFHLTNVAVWVVDLTQLAPLGGPALVSTAVSPPVASKPFVRSQSVRKSFSKQRPSPEAKALMTVKTIEEVEKSETDPEEEIVADIPNIIDYRDVFQPNRSLNRSPPPTPFPPPISDEDMSLTLPVPTVNTSPEPQSMEQSSGEGECSMEEVPSPLPPASPRRRVPSPQLYAAARQQPLRRLSSYRPPDDPPSPSSEFPVKQIHHSPSEPALNRSGQTHSRSGSLTASRLPYQPRSPTLQRPPPTPARALSPRGTPSHINKPVASVKCLVPDRDVKDEKEDNFIPMDAVRPTGLNLDDFLPKNYQQTLCHQQTYPDMSEEEVFSVIMRPHESVMTVLKARERSLQIVYSLWRSKDIKTAVDSAIAMNDQAVIVDILGVITHRPGIWNLDLCAALLPAIHDLLQSKLEMYLRVGSDALHLILRNFSPVIKSNVTGAAGNVGVDISREERYSKCVKCYNSLVSIRTFLLKRQTMQGKIGQHFRELHNLLQALDN